MSDPLSLLQCCLAEIAQFSFLCIPEKYSNFVSMIITSSDSFKYFMFFRGFENHGDVIRFLLDLLFVFYGEFDGSDNLKCEQGKICSPKVYSGGLPVHFLGADSPFSKDLALSNEHLFV